MEEKIPKKLLVLNAVLLFAVIGTAFSVYNLLQKPAIAKNPEPEIVAARTAFDDINLEAKSAYVLDVVENKIIYKKNELAQLPLASLTKLLTALVATEILPKESHVTVRQEFLQEEGDNGLLPEEEWRLRNLLDFSLVSSSNDGARSVASVVGAFSAQGGPASSWDYNLGRKEFVEKMNTRAKELGMQQSYFINESGLDIGETGGGYGSAVDVAKLLKYILINEPALLEATKSESMVVNSFNKTHTVKNTNIDVAKIPGLIASKTGNTKLAGGNLAIAFDTSIGRPIIVVVLGSTEKGRFEDIQKLVQASLSYISE
jgi:D-alanyl-D-alanine carboxypeptidase